VNSFSKHQTEYLRPVYVRYTWKCEIFPTEIVSTNQRRCDLIL